MHCEYCKNEHQGTYGSGRFCCKGCASAYSTASKRKDINAKVSEKLSGRASTNKGKKQTPEHIKKRIGSLDRKQISDKIKNTRHTKYLMKTFDELGPVQKRKRIFEEQKFKCNKCGISEWMGETIKLELEHKDGNTSNNLRNNLEGLCPNCHSLTPTWRKKKSALVVE